MAHTIAQILGVIITAGVIINLQFKKKKHIYIASIILNALSALQIYLIGQGGSGMAICLIANVQILFSMWHDKKNTDITLAEKIIFLIIYIVVGALGYNTPLDLLSIVAAVFYMLAMCQKKEQNIRLFLLGNMLSWTIFHLVLRSTAIFAQLAGIASSLVALYRYRKKPEEKPSEDECKKEN